MNQWTNPGNHALKPMTVGFRKYIVKLKSLPLSSVCQNTDLSPEMP